MPSSAAPPVALLGYLTCEANKFQSRHRLLSTKCHTLTKVAASGPMGMGAYLRIRLQLLEGACTSIMPLPVSPG